MIPLEELVFRKKINKINTLRASLREKKTLFAKLTNVPEATEEALKLKSEIDALETQIHELCNLR